MKLENIIAKPTAIGTFWGVIGGFSLIIATITTTNGYLQIVPYFFILCAAILTTKYVDKANVNFGDLFKSGFFAFFVSSLFLYTYILTVVNPNSGISFIGHFWRFVILVGLGIVSSSFISFVAKPVR